MTADNSASLRILLAVTVPITVRTVLRGQATFLHSRGHEVHIATSEGKAFAENQSDALVAERHVVPFSRRLFDPLADFRALIAILRILRHSRPDVVVAGTPKAGLITMLAARALGVPRIYVLHGLRLEGATGLTFRLMRIAEKAACSLADCVAVVGDQLLEKSRQLGVVSVEKSFVLGSGSASGIDVHRFRPVDANGRAKMREEAGLPTDSFVVGFVGRLTPDKGLSAIVEAWPLVLSAVPEALLMVVGGIDATGGITDALVTTLDDLPHVVRLGEVADPERTLPMLDLLILPSKREGLPTVVLEAAACGIPAVMTDVTGARDAIIDGETGLIVPLGRSDMLASAVVGLADEHSRTQMGAAARRRVCAHFAQADVCQRYARLYEHIAHSQQTNPQIEGGSR